MKESRRKGLFITVEGMEAAGKSSAIRFIVEWAQRYNLDIICTKEPGGTDVGLRLREVFLSDLNSRFSPMAELCTLFACKAQLLNDVVVPGLLEGKVVICDRFTDTLFAYQGGGKGYPKALIERLERATLTELEPDATILMEVPLNVSLQRIRARNPNLNNVMDFMPEAFYKRVNRSFQARAKDNPRYHRVDGNQGFDGVRAAIFEALDKALDHKLPYLTGDTYEYVESTDIGQNRILTATSK